MKTKRFPVLLVLTLGTQYAFIEASGLFGISEFLELLKPVCDFMTQSKNWLHDIARISEEVKPYIREQHVWIVELNAKLDNMNAETRNAQWSSIVSEVIQEHGETIKLFPMHREDHLQIDDPLKAFEVNNMHPRHVEIIELDDEEPPLQ